MVVKDEEEEASSNKEEPIVFYGRENSGNVAVSWYKKVIVKVSEVTQ